MYPITDAARALFEANEAKVVRITGSTVRILPTDIAVYSGDTLIYQSGDGKGLKLYSGSSEIYDNQGTRTIILYSGNKPIFINDEAGMPVQIDITSSDVRQGDFSIDRYSCNGQTLEIGTAIASEMTLRLDNIDGQFDGVIFEGVELFVEIGISDSTDGDGEIYWVPCGYFTCDHQPRNLNTLSLKALDRMMRFDRKLVSSAVTLPKTVAQLVAAGCAACNVALGQSLSGLPNANYSVTALPATQEGITWRDILRWCAGLMGANAWIDWNGELRFSWYNNKTGYVSTTDNRFNSDLYENPIVITGVKFTDSDEANTTYIAGTDDYALDLSDNSLLNADNADALLPNIYVAINGFAYTPFSASALAAPYLWPMDRVTFTDKDGKGHVSVLTNVNLSVNGSTDIAAVGESAEFYSYGKTSSFTARQQAALRRIQRVVGSEITDAVESATAQITGAQGGHVRFMYDSSGNLSEILIMNTPDIATATKVWRWNQGGFGYSSNGYQGPYTTAITQDGAIVANFITTGILNAAIVKAGILGDAAGANYWNMVTGEFKLSGGAGLGDSTVGDVLDAIEAAIVDVDVEYAQNQSTTTAPTTGWSTAAPAWQEGYYIWQRTATTTDSGTTYSAPTCISGRDGMDGAPGAQGPAGVGIVSVTEYYARNNSGTSAPADSAFTTSVKTPTSSNRFVWNYELITYTDGSTSSTTKHIVAVFGNTGATGNGIASIAEYYAVNNSTTAPADSAFSTAISAPSAANKYLWNYEEITYTNGSTETTGKRIIGTFGERGEDGTSVSILGAYDTLAELQAAHPTGNPGDGYMVGTDLYVWNDSTSAWEDVGRIQGPEGPQGAQGPAGVGIASITEYYAVNDDSATPPLDNAFSTQVQTPTANNRFLWNYEQIGYTNNTVTNTDKRVIGTYGETGDTGATGATGNGIASIAEYYAVNNSTTAPADNAFSTAVGQTSAANKYLWNYELITYTNGNTVKSAKRIIGTYGDTGAQGPAGINTATVNLYQRAVSAPAKPNATLTYTFATATLSGSMGNWSTSIPDGTAPCWVIAATAASNTATDTIAASEWSSPVKLVENGANGANGTNGTNGLNQATIYLYQRKATAPTKPNTSVTYTFATGALSSVPTGWSRNIPSGTNPCWVTSAVAISTDETDTIASSEWADVIKLVENGENGAQGAQGIGVSAIVEQYYLSTSSTTQTGGSWSTNQPAWVSGKYIWTRSQVTWTTNNITYTTPVLAKAINGANSSANDANTAASNAQSAANAASSAVTALDTSLNQQGVFNRLTNNGQTQGIYLKDGKLYVNASFIGTGEMSAERITSGTMSAARISGGMLSLGGSNNANGVLSIKDSDGEQIGRWDNTGLIANGSVYINGAGDSSVVFNQSDFSFVLTKYNLELISKSTGLSDTHVGVGWFLEAENPQTYGRYDFFISDAPVSQKGNSVVIHPNSIVARYAGTNAYYFRVTPGVLIHSGNCYIGEDLTIHGNLSVEGKKLRLVTTEEYGKRLLYCYETPTPMFGDIGEGVIGDDGLCYVTLDAIFAQTVTTDQYQVFLQKYGPGDCWVKERRGAYFIVEGDPGLKFGWEIKAKQRDYDQLRLERNDEPFTPPTQTYGEDAAKHIDEIRKEREAA